MAQEEYGTDTSASSFMVTKSEAPSDIGEQAAPPNLPFRELLQKFRKFLSIPDPAAEEEDYKLGSALVCDPLLFQSRQTILYKTCYAGRSLTSPKCPRWIGQTWHLKHFWH